jgi:hypothetical protein
MSGATSSTCLNQVSTFSGEAQGGALTDEQDQTRVALVGLGKLIIEQARDSTAHLSPERLESNIGIMMKLKHYYEEVFINILQENIQVNIERIIGKRA